MALIDDPEHLRMRAAEMQARADKAIYPEIRQGLSRIAEDYHLLARRAEQRLAVGKLGQDSSAKSAVASQKVPEAIQGETVSEVPFEPPDPSETP